MHPETNRPPAVTQHVATWIEFADAREGHHAAAEAWGETTLHAQQVAAPVIAELLRAIENAR